MAGLCERWVKTRSLKLFIVQLRKKGQLHGDYEISHRVEILVHITHTSSEDLFARPVQQEEHSHSQRQNMLHSHFPPTKGALCFLPHPVPDTLPAKDMTASYRTRILQLFQT